MFEDMIRKEGMAIVARLLDCQNLEIEYKRSSTAIFLLNEDHYLLIISLLKARYYRLIAY